MDGARQGRRGRSPKTRGPAPFRSLIVPLDLSQDAARIVERVSLLPLAESARICLAHVLPAGLPARAAGSAAADARRALAASARKLERASRQRAIEIVVRTGSAAAEIARTADAVRADLVVIGRGRGGAVRDFFLGSTTERVVRQARRPALVVRRVASAPYGRPLAALDADAMAHDVVAELLRIVPRPRPRISLVHAYTGPLSHLVYPSLPPSSAAEYRHRGRQEAMRELTRRLAAAASAADTAPSEDDVAWRWYLRFGSARAIIPRIVARTHADLLAIGTHAHGAVARVFLGTVAGDVLRDVPCDVLVVPPRGDPSLG